MNKSRVLQQQLFYAAIELHGLQHDTAERSNLVHCWLVFIGEETGRQVCCVSDATVCIIHMHISVHFVQVLGNQIRIVSGFA